MSNLIDEIKKRNIEIVFAYDLSRISRDLFDSNLFFKLIDKYNVTLKCLYEDVKIKTASDRFTTNIKVLNNQYERERVIERTNDALTQIVKGGRYPCGGSLLFGYTRGEDKNVYVDPKASQIVIHAIEMGKQCESMDNIRKYLNEAQNQIYFTVDRVRRLFNDERYAGIFKYKGEIYTNIIPAITTIEDLEVAKNNYRKMKYKKNEKYYFDGMVFCSICGKKMSCTHSYGKTKVYYYYECHNCKSTINQLYIEDYICDMVIVNKEKENRKKGLILERNKLKRRIKEYKEKFLDERLTDKEYCCVVIPFQERINELEVSLLALQNKYKNLLFGNCKSDKEKKGFAIEHIKRIVVNPVEKIVVEVKTI